MLVSGGSRREPGRLAGQEVGQEVGRGMNDRPIGHTQTSFVFVYQLEITNNSAALHPPSVCVCVCD